jgi:acetyl-CoA carboxylase biotin carboxyl carrier protein
MGIEAPPPAPAPAAAPAPAPQEDVFVLTSPIVGTFYRSPSPTAEPFVKVGDTIEVGGVVGIVEAMKLMNPIQAEGAGVVTDVLVGNAETVEFGQPLIAVEPTS